MSFFVNAANALFIGATHLLVQHYGFVLPAWILSLSLLSCAVIANIYFYRFPRLRFMPLRKFAQRILKKFPNAGIRKIVLRKYDSPYSKQMGGDVPTKYHLIILLDSPLSNEGKELQLSAINFHGVDGNNLDRLGLKNDFVEVYRQKPNDGYLKEWSFVVPDDWENYDFKGHFEKGWSVYIRNFT